MTEGRINQILFWIILCILIWPISMIFLGIRYRNECSDQPQLSFYLLIFGSIWIILFLLSIFRYYFIHRYIDLLILIIWLLLLLLIIPGYIYIFHLRSIIKLLDYYPDEICEKNFYYYSSILIILVHIPLYIFLWISWSLTHLNNLIQDRQRSIRIFTITPMQF
ncbi:hypothetical protein I4U23_017286 [Adineta vaga]|nr:hypothetical protein I4U23_017286 [Adineta vaga]